MPSTSNSDALTDQPLAGKLIGENFHAWPDEVRQDFVDNEFNGKVGSRLVSESDRVRVWEIRLQPGQRVAAHRHIVDYFWTAINPGSSRQHTAHGTTREVTYLPGQTRHFHCAEGEYLLHDLKTWVTPNWCSRQSNFLTAPIPHCRFTESEAPQLRDFSSQG